MSNSSQKVRTRKSGNNAGRPTSEYGKKKNRSVSLSSAAHQGLKSLASQYGAKNLSEFLEKLGNQELTLPSNADTLHSVFAQTTIDQQLDALIRIPNGAICSTLAFTLRLASQLGLPQKVDFLHLVLLDAMSAVFYLDYLSPHIAIDSPTAWLRWYILHILENRKKALSDDKDVIPGRNLITYSSPEKFTKKCISSILDAREQLATQDKLTHLHTLRLRMPPEEMHLHHIKWICSTQEDQKPVFELLTRGMSTFRKLWINPQNTEEIYSDDEYELKTKRLGKAIRYCELMQLDRLSRLDLDELKGLIKEGLHRPDYDFWANEIDYLIGCKTCKKKDLYEEETKKINMLLINTVSISLLKMKEDIDIEMMRILNSEKPTRITSLPKYKIAQCLDYSPIEISTQINSIFKEVISPSEVESTPRQYR